MSPFMAYLEARAAQILAHKRNIALLDKRVSTMDAAALRRMAKTVRNLREQIKELEAVLEDVAKKELSE